MRKSSLLDGISFNSYAVQQDEQQRISYTIKIMLLGAKSVGKSRMLQSYTHQKKPNYQVQQIQYNKSQNLYHTEGIDFVSKVQEINNIQYHLHIWDTADFNQFIKNKTFFQSLCNGVLGFIIVYDITRKESYELTNVIFNAIKGDLRRQVFLVGTNLDKANKGQRQVNIQTVTSYAATRNITVHQIDCTKYEEVQQLFQQLLQNIIEKKGIVFKPGTKINRFTGTDGFKKRYNRCC